MKIVVGFIVCGGALVLLALYLDSIGVSPDWVDAFFFIGLVIIAILPMVFITGIGRSTSRLDLYGRRYSKLKIGTRVFWTIVLGAVLVWAAYQAVQMPDWQRGYWADLGVRLLILTFYGGPPAFLLLIILRTRFVWDDREVVFTRAIFKKQYLWKDISAIEATPDGDSRLVFISAEGVRSAFTVSYLVEGQSEIMAEARKHLENARTSRG